MTTDAMTAPAEVSPRETYLHQKSRCEEAQEPAFLDQFVRPHYRGAAAAGGVWETEVIQLDSSGAATVGVKLHAASAASERETSEEGEGATSTAHSVFLKIFPFDDGPEVYRKLTEFRGAGFGAGNRYQSVEPLAWYDEQKLLLCEGAPGTDVEVLFDLDRAAWQHGVAESGAWLGRFHTAGLSVGASKPLLVTSELTSLAKRMAKAVAEHPEHLEVALGNLKILDAFAEETQDGLAVQSHGQFRMKHVFLTGPTHSDQVTVIDLDRSAPADPGRDVAEFVQRMRTDVFERGGNPPDGPTGDFLHAYVTATGSESYLVNFRFHYARHLVHRINRVIKKGLIGADLDISSEFLRTELDDLATGRFAR